MLSGVIRATSSSSVGRFFADTGVITTVFLTFLTVTSFPGVNPASATTLSGILTARLFPHFWTLVDIDTLYLHEMPCQGLLPLPDTTSGDDKHVGIPPTHARRVTGLRSLRSLVFSTYAFQHGVC